MTQFLVSEVMTKLWVIVKILLLGRIEGPVFHPIYFVLVLGRITTFTSLALSNQGRVEMTEASRKGSAICLALDPKTQPNLLLQNWLRSPE